MSLESLVGAVVEEIATQGAGGVPVRQYHSGETRSESCYVDIMPALQNVATGVISELKVKVRVCWKQGSESNAESVWNGVSGLFLGSSAINAGSVPSKSSFQLFIIQGLDTSSELSVDNPWYMREMTVTVFAKLT